MRKQRDAVIEILGDLPEWLTEINGSPNHKIKFTAGVSERTKTEVVINNAALTTAGDRVHGGMVVNDLHPFPRIVVATGQWSFDFHGGNCKSDSMLMVCFQLIRPALIKKLDSATDYENLTPAQVEQFTAQTGEIEGFLQNIWESFSEASYKSGAAFAQAEATLVQGPWLVPRSELDIVGENNEPIHSYWTNFRLQSKSN